MGCTIERWTAKATGSDSDRVITVRGEGECTTSNYEPRLELTNEGVVDNPDLVAVALVVEEPGTGPEVVTPVQVEIEINGDPATRVRIDTAEGSESVDVKEA
jgi:hypothetical protein